MKSPRALGREMTPYIFEISTSTHYGRMVMVDDNTVVLFGNMDDVKEYHLTCQREGGHRRGL